MSANVEITDTFDQWRVKTNEWLSMTYPAGSDNFIKLNNTTNATSNTTGSIITAGGVGIAKSAVIGGDFSVFGTTEIAGTVNLADVDIDGAVQIDGTVTVGVDDTGTDVKFFGATSGSYMLWDQSEDDLVLAGAAAITIANTTDSSSVSTGAFHTAGGVGIGKKLYVGTDLDVNGTTNLDAVDIDGAVQIDATLSVGVDDTGADVKFFGATSGAYLLWDQANDDLVIAGGAAISIDATTDASSTTTGSFHTDGGVGIAKKLYVGTDLDVNGTANLDAVDIDGAVQIDAAVTVGVDGTGADVKFFGATSGAYMLWDQANDDLVIAGGAALSIDATTDATNTTSGSFHTDGGAGIAKKLYVGTDLDVNGTANLDAVDIDGATQIDATLSVGINDTGYDVKFFGATAGKYWLWDESADGVVAVSDLQQTGTITVGVDDTGHDVKFFGATSGKSLLWDESADSLIVTGTTTLVGTTNLDAVDIDGATQIDAAVTVGVDGTGYDVKLFGATASAYLLWDESADSLILAGAAALSIDATTDSSSTTTGSFHTDGGVGIAGKLFVGTDLDVNGTTNLDAVDIDGAVQLDATLSVGVNDTGYNVKLFGATSGAYLLWDQANDDLVIAGGAAISIDATTDASSTTTGSFHTDGGVGIAKKLYVGTDLDVNGTTNLDVVDIDGATQIDGAVTVGVNDTGYDVKFFGATSGKYWLWDESADKTIQVSDSQLTGALTVGVDDTGHDVIFYGAAAGAFMMWDQSADSLLVRGASADAVGSSGRIVLQTAQTAVADGDILGRIDWNAPAETGTDAIVVGASIWAEADATFSETVNSTDLVFATGDSAVATEKMRIDSTGQVLFADGAIDVNIASHDGTNGLKLGGTLLTVSASDLNNASLVATIGKSIAMAMVFGTRT